MQISKLSALLLTIIAAAQPALSTIVVTQPVAATQSQGGRRLEIEWHDDNQDPKVDAQHWGRINIFLATGSVNTQFKLAQLAANVAPSATSFSAIVPNSVGPDGKTYFLRFEGSVLDPKGIPPMAFSARFQLNGMRGQFNSTIQAANQGASDIITGPGGAAATTTPSTSSTSTPGLTPSSRPPTISPSGTPVSSGGKPSSAEASVGLAAKQYLFTAAAAGTSVLIAAAGSVLL